jgi:nucleotide-binding universal stress UspA family protein
MSVILCALRGGTTSKATISRAISLAQDVSLPVHFLYVVNRELVSQSTHRTAFTAKAQLRQMGRSMLLVAQAIANSHGIAAHGGVRDGNVEDQIIGQCQELDAEYLVLNQSNGQETPRVFTPDRMERFKDRVREETTASIVMVGQDGQ